jgi:hypothetical protein
MTMKLATFQRRGFAEGVGGANRRRARRAALAPTLVRAALFATSCSALAGGSGARLLSRRDAMRP